MIRDAILFGACALTLYACSNEAKPTYPQRRGGRGDPCLVLNDCKEPLVCRVGRCLDPGSELKATGKECVVAECIDDADCCQPVSLPRQAACEANAAECWGNVDCENAARRPCAPCRRVCDDHRCVSDAVEAAGCLRDDDCLRGACVAGECSECNADADCGEGLRCEGSACRPACTRDEQCGRLSYCDEGRCAARGCVSQRECILLLGEPDAQCRDETCVVPCDADSACAALGALYICDKGVCKSLGCEENVDCSARDGAQGALMLCLDLDEAARLRAIDPFSFLRGTSGVAR